MIRKANIGDERILAEMAVKVWDSSTVEELEVDFESDAANTESACFIAYDDKTPIGFAHCTLRHDYVEGTQTSPVGYLEGIFVEDKYRKQGIAKQLLESCEQWAKEMGCTEFASDCELTNTDSLKFHLAIGFEEANRIICFKKNL